MSRTGPDKIILRYTNFFSFNFFKRRSISCSGDEDAYWGSVNGRANENEENLQNTRHMATCIDWAAELAPCCTKTKWRHIIPHLPPRYVGKEYGNTTWNRSRAAWIIIHFMLPATYGVRVGAVHLQKCTRVCVSPCEPPQRRRAGGRRTFISLESVYMTGIW